eukprot:8240752-Pyramimonas_sp.AAC.1
MEETSEKEETSETEETDTSETEETSEAERTEETDQTGPRAQMVRAPCSEDVSSESPNFNETRLHQTASTSNVFEAVSGEEQFPTIRSISQASSVARFPVMYRAIASCLTKHVSNTRLHHLKCSRMTRAKRLS